jgi:hypothetical protein
MKTVAKITSYTKRGQTARRPTGRRPYDSLAWREQKNCFEYSDVDRGRLGDRGQLGVRRADDIHRRHSPTTTTGFWAKSRSLAASQTAAAAAADSGRAVFSRTCKYGTGSRNLDVIPSARLELRSRQLAGRGFFGR